MPKYETFSAIVNVSDSVPVILNVYLAPVADVKVCIFLLLLSSEWHQ